MNVNTIIAGDKSEEIYSKIFRISGSMLSISRIEDGLFIQANDAFLTILGYSHEELIGKTSQELGLFVNPEDRTKLLKTLEQNGHVRNIEIRVRAKDREIHDMLFSADEITISDERCWLIAAADITELRRQERELREAETKLLQSEELFRLAALSVSNVIWKWNILTGALDWFGNVDALLGYAENELPRTIKAWKNVIDPRDVQRVMQKLEKHLATNENYDQEYRIRRKDGSIRFWRDRGHLVRNASGKPIRMIGAIEDITSRKTYDEERALLIEQMHLANANLEQFASVASHDLQEPLRMVAGFVNLLKQHYSNRLDAQANEYITYTVDGVVRMQKLISDILNLTRAGAKRRSPSLIDSGQTLDEALRNLEMAIAGKDVLVSMEDMPPIWFEHFELCRIFQNLIANALKFCRENCRLFIHIGVRELENEWEFSVSDNGIGFDLKDTSRIFSPFERLHRQHKYNGTGIGLPICKKIIEHYGGRIWASSMPGEGSIFSFTVPKKPITDP